MFLDIILFLKKKRRKPKSLIWPINPRFFSPLILPNDYGIITAFKCRLAPRRRLIPIFRKLVNAYEQKFACKSKSSTVKVKCTMRGVGLYFIENKPSKFNFSLSLYFCPINKQFHNISTLCWSAVAKMGQIYFA